MNSDQSEIPAQKADMLSPSMDMAQFQRIVALDTAAKAGDILVKWGVRVLVVIIFSFAVLGLTSYVDLRSRIDNATERANKVITDKRDEVLKNINSEYSQLHVKIVDLQKEIVTHEQRAQDLRQMIDSLIADFTKKVENLRHLCK